MTSSTDRSRWLRQRLLSVLLVMAAAFHFGPARHPNLQAFGRTRPEDVATLVYWSVLLVWAVYALVGITRLCWRLSSATSSELVSPTSLELSSRPSPGSTLSLIHISEPTR